MREKTHVCAASVRKAVFPAAGLGTRFLPATKAQPKEMMPLVDKPLIQYVVEEAVDSGIQNIMIVTGRGKNAIEDHFDVSYELETILAARGNLARLKEVQRISSMIDVSYVRQKEALGLGHAILTSRGLIGNEQTLTAIAEMGDPSEGSVAIRQCVESSVASLRQEVEVDEHRPTGEVVRRGCDRHAQPFGHRCGGLPGQRPHAALGVHDLHCSHKRGRQRSSKCARHG